MSLANCLNLMMQLQTRWQGVGNFMDAVSEIINPIITDMGIANGIFG